MLVTAFNGAVNADPCTGDLAVAFVQDADTQEDDKAKQETGEENPVDAIAAKFEKEQMEFWQKIEDAAEEDREDLFAKAPTADDYAEEIKKLAEENLNSDIAESAYTWMISNIRDEELVAEAYDQLFTNFIKSEKLSGVCMNLVY